MNQNQLNASLNQLEQFTRDIKSSGFTEMPAEVRRLVTFSRGELGGLTLWDDEVKQYTECIHSLLAAVNDRRQIVFSEKAAEEAVQDTVLRGLDINDSDANTLFDQKLANALQDLRKRVVAAPVEWDLYFQVLGVHLKDSGFCFGDVRFLPADHYGRRFLKHRMFRILLDGQDSLKVKRDLIKFHRKRIKELFSEGAIAWLTVSALDKDAAQAIASEKLGLTLEVLNFYSLSVHPRDLRVRAFLPGQALFHARTLTFSFKGDAGVNVEAGLRGPISLFDLSSLNGKRAIYLGVARISYILSKANRNPLEKRLLAAMRYAGRASIQEIREEAFLQHAIAMESLLGDVNSEGEITYKLATRCAHLLGQDVTARKDIAGEVKKLYGVRSKIVHRGKTDLTDLELSQLQLYVRNALVTALTKADFHMMADEDAFIAWFHEKVLS